MEQSCVLHSRRESIGVLEYQTRQAGILRPSLPARHSADLRTCLERQIHSHPAIGRVNPLRSPLDEYVQPAHVRQSNSSNTQSCPLHRTIQQWFEDAVARFVPVPASELQDF